MRGKRPAIKKGDCGRERILDKSKEKVEVV